MKKMIMALAAMMIVSTAAMAQNERPRGGKKIDRTEMAKKRTDAIVKKYDLNEEQAKKLLELNTKYMGQMHPGAGAGVGARGKIGPRKDMKRDTTMRKRVMPAKNNRMREGINRSEMRENMKKYDEELKSIMTEEQYSKYQKDKEERRNARLEKKKDK